MTAGRIVFAGNPWPEGHAVDEFAWTMRAEGDMLWFDLHLRSTDYYAERDIDDNDEGAESDWTAAIVWGNYHRCTLSSTAWGGRNGFPVCPLATFSPRWLDGRRFDVDPLPGVVTDPESHAFHIYLLGHDSAANHRIAFRRNHSTGLFDIDWRGEIALTYAGNDTLEHRFHAELSGVPCPPVPGTAA